MTNKGLEGTVRFEDLPMMSAATGRGREGVWVSRLEPLIHRPGEWAIVHISPSQSRAGSVASNLRHGLVKLPPGKWEFASRTVGDEYRVYGRFLGLNGKAS